MLQSVLTEMQGDAPQTSPEAKPEAKSEAEPEGASGAPAVNLETFDEMFAERDVKIAELQHAVVELSNSDSEAGEHNAAVQIAALTEQLAKLEARSFEQERTIRQTLSMLIEWIESEMDSSKAA